MNTFRNCLRALATAMANPSGIRAMVMCGPSGSGKSTLLAKLMQEYPDKFAFCTSHTTRTPRAGEVDGVHYHFTRREDMSALIDAGGFIEHAVFGGNLYGTSKAAINKVLAAGKVCILDIETQGVRQVKESNYAPHYVFIKPPSMEVLKERLTSRNTETEESMNKRLSYAREEIEYGTTPGNFDVIIVNDELEKAYQELLVYVTENMFVDAPLAPTDKELH